MPYLIFLVLSVLHVLCFVAPSAAQERLVAVLVDASGSVNASVEKDLESAFAGVDPPLGVRVEVTRWDTKLIPYTTILWQPSRNLSPLVAVNGGGTKLELPLRSQFAVLRKQTLDCARVVVVVHGKSADLDQVSLLMERELSIDDFLVILVIPTSNQDDAVTAYANITSLAAPHDGRRVARFSAQALHVALNAAAAHPCVLNTM